MQDLKEKQLKSLQNYKTTYSKLYFIKEIKLLLHVCRLLTVFRVNQITRRTDNVSANLAHLSPLYATLTSAGEDIVEPDF